MNKSIYGYFQFLAEAFPVQCASDDFDTYPHVEAAAAYYHDLDDLDATRMTEHADQIRSYQSTFATLAEKSESLRERAKLETLVLSATSILLDLESAQSWRRNPLTYLRIAFNGLDQAMSSPASRSERLSRVAARVAALPRLFRQAKENLRAVPRRFKYAARIMAEDGTTHLLQIASNREIFPIIESALQSLKQFKLYLGSLPEISDEDVPGPNMDTVLSERFGYPGTPDQVFTLAQQQWRASLSDLEAVSVTIDPSRTWLDLYTSPHPDDPCDDLLNIYTKEIANLRHFFLHTSLAGLYPDCPLVVTPTPIHQRSLRSMVSYSSGLGTAPMEPSSFYVSPHGISPEHTKRLQHRLRREVSFIAAHDTYPGHHLSACSRRLNPCPVASQVILPLFSEGWADLAETLLPEYGYVNKPLDLLVHHRRRVWRAAACMIDVGINTGRLEERACIKLLLDIGFSRAGAALQVGLARLNPGHQLCALLGHHEILELR
ncbi:MAG: DUF885 domain-containing protein, partial [Proteobacteria bacterium]|nr:DUF885 domain-containing protein [Pseudomonadota bacterium]